MRDVLIVGGGMIGLGIGWQLARAGCAVTVVERDPADATARSGASWAAAGMLAPLAEAGFNEPALLALNRASLALYPEWVAELEADSGESVDYRDEGTLIAALDRDDAAWLRRQWEFQQQLGLPTEWLTGAEAREREPHLAPAITAAVASPADHQVDNRRMWSALRRAFLARGGELLEGTEATRIAHENGQAHGVWTGDELLEAPRTVVCAGAWTRLLMAVDLPAPAVPPIRPVKGQILALEMSTLMTLESVVRTRRVYLAPKRDGRLVIGATSEDVGFDTRLTAGGMLELLRDAWEAVPGIYDLPVAETWAGLRPASRDNAPVIGPTPLRGLWVAAGHFRNGVLLTPITARAMREMLLEGHIAPEVQPFALERFHTRRMQLA